jgi:hypothetical protein
MNSHYPLFRIAFAAAAAVFIFLMVHAALEGVSRSAAVLAGSLMLSRCAAMTGWGKEAIRFSPILHGTAD